MHQMYVGKIERSQRTVGEMTMINFSDFWGPKIEHTAFCDCGDMNFLELTDDERQYYRVDYADCDGPYVSIIKRMLKFHNFPDYPYCPECGAYCDEDSEDTELFVEYSRQSPADPYSYEWSIICRCTECGFIYKDEDST